MSQAESLQKRSRDHCSIDLSEPIVTELRKLDHPEEADRKPELLDNSLSTTSQTVDSVLTSDTNQEAAHLEGADVNGQKVIGPSQDGEIPSVALAPTPDPFLNAPTAPRSSNPVKFEMRKRKLSAVTQDCREAWVELAELKDVPSAVHLHFVITKAARKYQSMFSEALPLDLFQEAVNTGQTLQPMRDSHGVGCLECQKQFKKGRIAANRAERLFNFMALMQHFDIYHIKRTRPPMWLDWTREMIKLPHPRTIFEYVSETDPLRRPLEDVFPWAFAKTPARHNNEHQKHWNAGQGRADYTKRKEGGHPPLGPKHRPSNVPQTQNLSTSSGAAKKRFKKGFTKNASNDFPNGGAKNTGEGYPYMPRNQFARKADGARNGGSEQSSFDGARKHSAGRRELEHVRHGAEYQKSKPAYPSATEVGLHPTRYNLIAHQDHESAVAYAKHPVEPPRTRYRDEPRAPSRANRPATIDFMSGEESSPHFHGEHSRHDARRYEDMPPSHHGERNERHPRFSDTARPRGRSRSPASAVDPYRQRHPYPESSMPPAQDPRYPEPPRYRYPPAGYPEHVLPGGYRDPYAAAPYYMHAPPVGYPPDPRYDHQQQRPPVYPGPPGSPPSLMGYIPPLPAYVVPRPEERYTREYHAGGYARPY